MAAPTPVAQVDASRYMGVWYQIARNPVIFEKNCVCSRQSLELRTDGTIGVFNSCNTSDVNGRLQTIEGTATPDDSSNAKLTVDFGLPWKGEYWIVGLGASYEYAVVTDSKANSLYVLSRTPILSDELYNEAVAGAQAQLDTSKLQKTLQEGCSYP